MVYTLTSHRLLTIKGAPDVLIDRCTTITSDDGARRIFDDRTRATLEELKNSWSREGKRVILLARKIISQRDIYSLPSSSDFESEISKHARSGLTLVGLVGIVDPPVRSSRFVRQSLLIFSSVAKFLKWSALSGGQAFVSSW